MKFRKSRKKGITPPHPFRRRRLLNSSIPSQVSETSNRRLRLMSSELSKTSSQLREKLMISTEKSKASTP